MDKITLQDIITKKLNTLADTPDDLICDAYYQIKEARDTESRIKAYLAAQVAIKANEALGIQVPNLVDEMIGLHKSIDMTDEEMADYYMKFMDNN